MNARIVLFLVLALPIWAQTFSLSGGASASLPFGWVDPITSYGASGSNGTNGTINTSVSATTLTLANATGWSSGVGVAVIGAGASGAELDTICTTVSGNICTLATGASTSVSNAFVYQITTGTVSASSTSLTLANATGWSSGMGIGIVGAGASGAELDTACATISGTTCNLATAASTAVSGALVYHNDTSALTAAFASGSQGVLLRSGVYIVNSTSTGFLWTLTTPIWISGTSSGSTLILSRSATVGQFLIDNESSPSYLGTSGGAHITDLQIMLAASVTPTSGAAIALEGTNYTMNNYVERVSFNNNCFGLYIEQNALSNWFNDLRFVNTRLSGTCATYIGQGGILINSPGPAGDSYFNNISMIGSNAGVYDSGSDTSEFTNLKVNGSQIYITPINSAITRMRFIDTSIEGFMGGDPTCAITVGQSTEVQFVGGGVGGFTDGICVLGGVVGLRIVGMHFYGLTNPIILGHTGDPAGAATGTVIVGNEFEGSGTDIAFVAGANATVTGNTVKSGATYFISSDSTIPTITACGNSNPGSVPNNLNGATTITCGN